MVVMVIPDISSLRLLLKTGRRPLLSPLGAVSAIVFSLLGLQMGGNYERKVDWVFAPFLRKFIKGFIDDFCVYSSQKDHA